jgi:hypothetical protein
VEGVVVIEEELEVVGCRVELELELEVVVVVLEIIVDFEHDVVFEFR